MDYKTKDRGHRIARKLKYKFQNDDYTNYKEENPCRAIFADNAFMRAARLARDFRPVGQPIFQQPHNIQYARYQPDPAIEAEHQRVAREYTARMEERLRDQQQRGYQRYAELYNLYGRNPLWEVVEQRDPEGPPRLQALQEVVAEQERVDAVQPARQPWQQTIDNLNANRQQQEERRRTMAERMRGMWSR
jgi:hypothetical protein